MSNRRYQQFHLSLVKQPVSLYAKASIAATGVPTLAPKSFEGVESFVRTGVGAYSLTLENRYFKLLNLSIARLLASGAPASSQFVLRSESVAGSKVITIAFLDGAGAAVELVSGTTLFIQVELQRSSVDL